MTQEKTQGLGLGEKYIIQEALSNTERLEALKRSNNDMLSGMKNRAESELTNYAKRLIKEVNLYGDNPNKEITPEEVTAKVEQIKSRVQESGASNQDDMGYLLVTFLNKIGDIAERRSAETKDIVSNTNEINTGVKAEQDPAPVVELQPTSLGLNPENEKPKLDFSKLNDEAKMILEKGDTGKINSLNNLPGVSFIKYDNQEAMNKSWGKITAFTEKNTTEFKDPKSWNYAGGHDLSSESIANYLNKFKNNLTNEENTLVNDLKSNGIISEKDGKIVGVENKAVLVMFYSNSDNVKLNGQEMKGEPVREQIKGGLNHELAHGLYFTNPEFKKITNDIWNNLTNKKEISENLNKNYSNPNFHATEFLSYILFTGDEKDIKSNLGKNIDINELRKNVLKNFDKSSKDIKDFVNNLGVK